MIVSAAIKDEETGHVYALPAPARHHNILFHMADIKAAPGEQGFIDDNEGFVSRGRAAMIVMRDDQKLAPKNGKPRREPDHPRELFSEDLW